jgi:AraC-like DNA-binding protein
MAFRRFRDTTPMAHWRALRLELARSDLARAGRDGGSVTCVANACGFGSFSRFAADYKSALPRIAFRNATPRDRSALSQVIQSSPPSLCRSGGFADCALEIAFATEALLGLRGRAFDASSAGQQPLTYLCVEEWRGAGGSAAGHRAVRPQHQQAPCAPCAEPQAEVSHKAACSHLLCTAQTELELGDACHTQPALGHHSSDTSPSPCCSSHQRLRCGESRSYFIFLVLQSAAYHRIKAGL